MLRAPRRIRAVMESSLTDLVELLLLMAAPMLILLGCRVCNRRWDKAASVGAAHDAVNASSRQDG